MGNMDETNTVCVAGCGTSGGTFVKCSKCMGSYCYKCGKVSIAKVDSPSFKKTQWICPYCSSSRLPKNDNTPARPQTEDSQSQNITLRQKTRQKPATNVTRGGVRDGGPAKQPVASNVGSLGDIRDSLLLEIKESMSEQYSKLVVELGSIIRSSIEESLSKINADLATIKEDLDELRGSVTFISKEYDEIKAEIKTKSQAQHQLEMEVEQMKNSNRELTHRIAEMEQYSRACNIEVQCVPEFKSENLLTTIKQLAKTVSYELQDDDIHHFTRIAKQDNASRRPRSIIVKMKNPVMRDGLLAAVIKFNKAHPKEKLNSSHLGISGDKQPVYVGEHLSPYNRALHKATRSKAKENGYKFVWIRNGRIFVRKSENSDAIIIKTMDSVNKL